MTRASRLLISALAFAALSPLSAQGLLQPGVFSSPLRAFSDVEKAEFAVGAQMFQRDWVFEKAGFPWENAEGDAGPPGAGPVYNKVSCIACHAGNGRGAAPAEGKAIDSMVVRLSIAGRGAHNAPQPHPVYGGQLNPAGAPGVPGEGEALLHYATELATLADGATVELRKPRIEFRGLAYGPIEPTTKISVRNAPPVAGLGQLAKVPEQALRDIAAQNGGRLNHVWDREANRLVVGRFGWKANQPSVAQQAANAFAEDMGVTSRLFPTENCTGAQTACLVRATQDVFTELPDAQFEAVTFYLDNLAPPPRRNADKPEALAGAAVFRTIGCSQCHREKLPIAGGDEIAAYTDLALHDMGAGLADGRPDYEAGPRDWRTPPLWGLGASAETAGGLQLLHDGRARSFAEAILWHGGQARPAAEAFRALTKSQREALDAFLASL